MGIIRAYFDESGKQSDHPVVAFCGICATEAKLREFDDEWNSLLRHYRWRSLHMKDMMSRKKFSHTVAAHTPKQRSEEMKPFADCINNHLEFGIVQAIDVAGFHGLSKGMRAGLGSPKDPNYVAFARALLELVTYCRADDRISLICDHDNETAWHFFSHYKGIRHAHPLVRKMTISLSFADDEYFPSLQAADLVAFSARHEAKWQFYRERSDYRWLLNYMVNQKPNNATMQWRVGFHSEALLRSIKTNADIVREQEERIQQQSFPESPN